MTTLFDKKQVTTFKEALDSLETTRTKNPLLESYHNAAMLAHSASIRSIRQPDSKILKEQAQKFHASAAVLATKLGMVVASDYHHELAEQCKI